MVPFFIFYSMFGFQRVGDLIWAAADAGARGFLLGATAGRTTLLGEGLQHQDGHSLLLASTVPACRAYDPAFAFEMAAHRPRRHPADVPRRRRGRRGRLLLPDPLQRELPDAARCPSGVEQGVVEGLYRWSPAPRGRRDRRRRSCSPARRGRRRPEAQAELAERYGVGAELWSATSYKQLRDEALSAERWNRLHPGETPRVPLVTQQLSTSNGPIVAVTDFMRAVPDQIARWSPRSWRSLGTDGFGRSDTREALRRFFETDAEHVVVAVLTALADEGVGRRERREGRHRPLRHRRRLARPLDRLNPDRPVRPSRSTIPLGRPARLCPVGRGLPCSCSDEATSGPLPGVRS